MAAKKHDLEKRRMELMQRHVVELAREDFDRRYPDADLGRCVALIAAYEEEENIGDVLRAMPTEACGMPVTTLVVVDGGDDRTADIVHELGVYALVFPVNLGHGVAQRAGYNLCIERGVDFIVTLDADGQNDPVEIPVMLQPLVDDESDFVVGSRRLGVDHTADVVRKAGVVFFSTVVNVLTRSKLTDTSNGYRALRTSMLADVVPRCIQVQYQTSELMITAISRGWRVSEKPTVWHPRAHGTTKKGATALYGFRYMNVVLRTWLRERR
jgi:glycosyltransferase involved in cell wall biosynthesis